MSEEVATRDPGHVVAVAPVPTQLAELGVRIGRDETSGLAVVVIPPTVRQHLNVINPVSSFAQADPNWTPSIALVQLDKEMHSYTVSGKVALNKQALETLGKAAGVLYVKTSALPKTELHPGERWGYRAIVGFRKQDGTVDEREGTRSFNEEAEKAEIESSVRGNPKFDTEAKVEAECRKRWINELKFGPAKTESKAINRALRAGLSVPISMSPQAFGKPFLVIGYSFTPDYDDAEVKRILVAAGLNARAAIYGGRDVAEIGPAESPAEGPGLDAPDEGDSGGPSAEGTDAPSGASDQQAGSAADDLGDTSEAESVPGSDPEPQPDQPEEPAVIEQTEFPVPDDVIAQLEGTIVDLGPDSGWTGKSLAEIASAGDKGHQWLAWALRQPDETLPGDLRANVHAFVKARVPELWTAFAGEEA